MLFVYKKVLGLFIIGPIVFSSINAQNLPLRVFDCFTGEEIKKFSVLNKKDLNFKLGDTLQISSPSYLTTSLIVREESQLNSIQICPVNSKLETVAIEEAIPKYDKLRIEELFFLPNNLEFAIPFKVELERKPKYVSTRLYLAKKDSALGPVVAFIMSSDSINGLPKERISEIDTFTFIKNDKVGYVAVGLNVLKLPRHERLYLVLRSIYDYRGKFNPYMQIEQKHFSSIAFYRDDSKKLPTLCRVTRDYGAIPSNRYDFWIDFVNSFFNKSKRKLTPVLFVRY